MGIRKVEDNTIYVEYDRPAFYKRVFSALLDFLILAFVFMGLVMCTDMIVKTTDMNKGYQKDYDEIKENSQLYKLSGASHNELLSIVTYYTKAENIKDMSTSDVKAQYETALNYYYYTFLPANITDKKLAETTSAKYDKDRLEFKFNGVAYFVKNGENVVGNPAVGDADFNTNFYEKYILESATGNLLKIDRYYAANVYFSKILIFIDVPAPLIVSSILVLYVPGLIMKRTRRSIGKLAFKIGLVNKDFLQVSFGRFTARFAIFLWGEIVLSLFTFGLPLIISFSMMVFLKEKQSFHDYVLGIEAIDITDSVIYKSKDDVLLEEPTKKAPDFKMIERL
ncbi:MAG: RDD family protein [Bacilli bacterium]